MSGMRDVRETAVNPSPGPGGTQGILIGLLKGAQGILIGLLQGANGILIGLLVGLTGILIGLLVGFAPPQMAMSFFDRGNEAGFQAAHCAELLGGEGKLLPAVNRADAGAGELLPAVNKAGSDGAQSCLNVLNLGLPGDARLMSFFGCQNNLRSGVGLAPMDYQSMCSAQEEVIAGGQCLSPCDPNAANACGDGLTCTKENGAYFCDGAACRQQPAGAACAEKCDPSAANACQPGLDCKPAGASFTCQSANCLAPTEQATQPPASVEPVETQPAKAQDQPPAVCTPNPSDRVCSACENTDLDSNACECNMDDVCGPQEGFNCGDCQADSGGGNGGKKHNNGGGNQCNCINGVDSCTKKKC